MAESKTIAENRPFFRCDGCSEEIRDKFLLQALDRLWHVYCLRCCDCGEALEAKCFFREGNIHCEADFYRRYGTMCSICQEGISPHQSVRKILDKVYHITCLSCVTCKRQLTTGDLFYLLQDGRVICKQDYDENKFSGDSDQSSPTGNSMKGKRARTFITAQQLKLLKSVYLHSPRPDLAERHRISRATGLDMRVVQVWFQNRRAKQRRLDNKSKNPWTNQLNKVAVKRSRSLSLDLSYSLEGLSPKVDHISDVGISEDDGRAHHAASHVNVSNTAQHKDALHQAALLSLRPFIARKVASAPVSPAVLDSTFDTRFPFPSHPTAFPPMQEMIDLCEEELRFLMRTRPACTQLSPTNSYYEADSESGMSGINTPTDETHFFYDRPLTPRPRVSPINEVPFAFDPFGTKTQGTGQI